jgi:hypothetical protein
MRWLLGQVIPLFQRFERHNLTSIQLYTTRLQQFLELSAVSSRTAFQLLSPLRRQAGTLGGGSS